MLASPERKKRSVLQYDDVTTARAFLDKNMSKDSSGLWQWDNGLTSAKAAAILGEPFTVGNISHLREKYKGTSRHFKQKVAPPPAETTLANVLTALHLLIGRVEKLEKDGESLYKTYCDMTDLNTPDLIVQEVKAIREAQTNTPLYHLALARDVKDMMEWATRQGYVAPKY